MEAEAAGLTYSEFMKQKDEASTLKKKNKASSNNKRKQTLDTNNNSAKKKKMSKAELEIESVKEKKELAKMMMTKKDKRLYEQIQFAKRKREAEAAVLEAKKSKLVKKKLSRAGGWSVGGAN